MDGVIGISISRLLCMKDCLQLALRAAFITLASRVDTQLNYFKSSS